MIQLSIRLYHAEPVVELLVRAVYNEPFTRLKLAVPTVLGGGDVAVDALGGVAMNPQDGQESVCQKWLCLRDDRHGLAICNDGAYGYDALDGEARVSLVRNTQYSTFGGDGWWLDRRLHPCQMDAGDHAWRLRLCVGKASEVVDVAAWWGRLLNQPVIAFPLFSRSAEGGEFRGPGTSLAVSISDKRIELAAVKRAEADDGVVLRLINHAGCEVKSRVAFEGRSVDLTFGRYEIKTLLAVDGGRALEACELIR